MKTELNKQLIDSLNGFPNWMNRPVKRVHVFTWGFANMIDKNCPAIRLLRPYRDGNTVGFRRRLANVIKELRSFCRIELPSFNEKLSEYNQPTIPRFEMDDLTGEAREWLVVAASDIDGQEWTFPKGKRLRGFKDYLNQDWCVWPLGQYDGRISGVPESHLKVIGMAKKF